MAEGGDINMEPVNKKRKRNLLKTCSNPACGIKSENCRVATYFVCGYFHLLKKESKKQKRVCPKCYVEAENHQKLLVEKLNKGQMVFSLEKRENQVEMVTIDDEEESSKEQESEESSEEVEIEDDNFEDVLKSLVEKYNFKGQVNSAVTQLGKQSCIKTI